MPIYEYRCASCGAELEKLQKISDPPLVECPECGKDTLTKLVSASSFRLKGSGWYETDFKTGKKKNGAGESDTATPDSAKGAAVDSGKDASGSQAGKDGTGERSKEAATATRKESSGADKSAGVESGKTGKGKDGGAAAGKSAPKE